jgi:hypothetical protein
MHTPGPWQVCERESCWAIQPETGKAAGNHNDVVYVPKPYPGDPTAGSVPSQGRTERELEANARLIAAAPDMYEQLEILVRWCRDPIVAETQIDNEAFLDAVTTAELLLARRQQGKSTWKSPT